MKDKDPNTLFELISNNFKNMKPERMANKPGAMMREDFKTQSPKGQESRIEQLKQALARTASPDLSNA